MQSIGLIGKMGSGKDTAASYLTSTYGYVRVSFAAPLKDMVIEADPLIAYDGLGTFNPVPVHLSDILSSGRDFEWCKRSYPEVRRSLQRIGQGVRKIDPDYWVRHALKEIRDLEFAGVNVVVTDVRYMNEAVALQARGFKLLRITRPASSAGMTMAESREALHDSETALDGWPADYTIKNDGTLGALADALRMVTH